MDKKPVRSIVIMAISFSLCIMMGAVVLIYIIRGENNNTW